MTPQELKNSILQLAIHGKLVEQRSEEGTGEELYWQIQSEKQRLIKDGIIKKERPLPEVVEGEIPFDIPESWHWVRIGNLLHKLVDGTHKTPKYTSSGVPFVSVRNMSNGRLSLEDTTFISEEEHRELWNRCNPQKGDILLSKVGTTGVPAKVDIDKAFSLFVSVALLKFNNDLLDIDFLVYSILAPDFQKQCKEHTRGVGNKNWVIVDIANTIMPLPPLAEQKRIVAKIEELLPYIDRYEQAWSKLEDFNKRFPEDMQKSILRMAIQGKLVEQRSEEGTGEELYRQIQSEKQRLIKDRKIKKEKPLPEITEDDVPFDIPESWKWVRVGNIGSWSAGATPSRTQAEYYGGSIPWLKTGDLNDGYVSDIPETITELALEKTSVRLNPVGSILMAMYGATIGKLGILQVEATTNQACCACIPYDGMWNKYLFYFLMANRQTFIKMGEGGAQPNISKEKIVNALIPLPPLAEQKRIVAKLEELLPLCEKLK